MRSDDGRSWKLAGTIVSIVFTILLGLVSWLGADKVRALDTQDGELKKSAAETDRRQDALESAFAALQSGNAVEHKLLLDGVSRIEKKLDAHMDREH